MSFTLLFKLHLVLQLVLIHFCNSLTHIKKHVDVSTI